MFEIVLHARNEAETKAIGKRLAQFAEPGQVIRLEGRLGAGKTTFTKGYAEGLGISRVIKSPTYTLIREYLSGRLPLYHMDLYRLEGGGAESLGLEEYIYGEGVSMIEWGSMAEEVMPEEYLLVKLVVTDEEGMERDIILKAAGKSYETLIENIQ